MRERFEKNERKNNQYLHVNKNEIIGINYYEDEIRMEFNKKRNNPNSFVSNYAVPRFIDVNVSKEDEEQGTNYLYNPILNIKDNSDDVFELTEIILKESGNNIPGSKMLLSALIFFVITFRPEEDRNFISIMNLLRMVYSPFKHDNSISGFDFIMRKITEENPDSMASILYSGFKVLEENEQKRIAVLLYETLLPFQLKKYKRFNSPTISCLNLKNNEYPCFMLYLDDYENCIQDKILANIFAMQSKNVSRVK